MRKILFTLSVLVFVSDLFAQPISRLPETNSVVWSNTIPVVVNPRRTDGYGTWQINISNLLNSFISLPNWPNLGTGEVSTAQLLVVSNQMITASNVLRTDVSNLQNTAITNNHSTPVTLRDDLALSGASNPKMTITSLNPPQTLQIDSQGFSQGAGAGQPYFVFTPDGTPAIRLHPTKLEPVNPGFDLGTLLVPLDEIYASFIFATTNVDVGGTNSARWVKLTGGQTNNAVAILVGDTNLVGHPTVSVTELGHLDGVSSALQTQIDGKQPLDSELTAWAAYSTNVIASTAQVLINASSNALYNLKQNADADLDGLAGLATTGIAVRTGAGTWTTRQIAVNTGYSVINGDGVSGNPQLDLDVDLLDLADGSLSGSKVGSGIDAANITTGNLSVSRLNGGTGASASTFWRGDGTWATPAGSGNGTMTTIRSNSEVVGTNLVAILTTNANVASPVEAQWSSNAGVATVSYEVKNLSGSGNIVASNSPTIFDATFNDGTVNTGLDFIGATVIFDAASPAQFGAAVIHNGKVTFNRDIIIPWEPVVASTTIYGSNGVNQFVTLGANTNWTFAPLSGSDGSNSMEVVVSVTQDSTGGYRPTLNGATLWINTNANQSSDVKIWVQNGATNASYELSYDLNSPQTGQVLEFHEPSGSWTNIHKNAFVNQALSGVGGANTNFTGLWTHEKVYINGGLTNVNFTAFMPGLSDRTYYLAYTLTNLTATSRQISFSSVTNRIQNMQQYHGLTLPITLTNNHTGELLVELSVTNAKISFLQYTNGF